VFLLLPHWFIILTVIIKSHTLNIFFGEVKKLKEKLERIVGFISEFGTDKELKPSHMPVM